MEFYVSESAGVKEVCQVAILFVIKTTMCVLGKPSV